MITATTIAETRACCDGARGRGLTVGLVPTMGCLHAGHRSLVRAARETDGFVVVSVFVNPTQFGPTEDLAGYPRDLDGDTRACEEDGVDLLFAPPVEEMYPEPGRTTVHVGGLTEGLCGRSRPTHFDGVTTVVTKLLSIVGPCRAYFGRKDAQQLAVVHRMAVDLDLPVEVVGCPLVRERDGLAMSSRNVYLSTEERRAALVLSRALQSAAGVITGGERDAATVRSVLVAAIEREPLVQLDYVEVVDGATMARLERLEGDVLVAVAAQVGRARLLDNVSFTIDGPSVTADLGVTHDSLEQ